MQQAPTYQQQWVPRAPSGGRGGGRGAGRGLPPPIPEVMQVPQDAVSELASNAPTGPTYEIGKAPSGLVPLTLTSRSFGFQRPSPVPTARPTLVPSL